MKMGSRCACLTKLVNTTTSNSNKEQKAKYINKVIIHTNMYILQNRLSWKGAEEKKNSSLRWLTIIKTNLYHNYFIHYSSIQVLEY